MATSNQHLVDQSKPVVWLYTSSTLEMENSRQIQFGLEEEGIPCEVKEVSGESAHALAVAAVKVSSLGVGVGLVDSAMEAVVHHRDLPDTELLIEVKGENFTGNLLRRLGANSARLAKGGALLDMKEPAPEIVNSSQTVEADPLLTLSSMEHVELIKLIVVEIMNTLNADKEKS